MHNCFVISTDMQVAAQADAGYSVSLLRFLGHSERVCVCVCTYVCMCVYVCIYMYVCVCMYVCVYMWKKRCNIKSTEITKSFDILPCCINLVSCQQIIERRGHLTGLSASNERRPNKTLCNLTLIYSD